MGHRIPYSDDELNWIKANSTRPRAEAYAEFLSHAGRHDVSLDAFKSLCKRKGWMTGRTGCFEKGAPPHNTGKKMPFNANSAATRFKKGNLPHNTKFAGHERLSKDGYWEISIDQQNPHTGFARRYVLKHRFLWEQLHGPVPAGMCLKSIDGNCGNASPSNWQLVPRALLPRLNGKSGRNYDGAPNELKPTIMAIAKLEHAARQKRKA